MTTPRGGSSVLPVVLIAICAAAVGAQQELRPAQILGLARLADGSAWAGAIVRVYAWDDAAAYGQWLLVDRQTRSDATGRFRVEVPRGAGYTVLLRDAEGRHGVRAGVPAGTICEVSASTRLAPLQVRGEGVGEGWQVWSLPLGGVAPPQRLALPADGTSVAVDAWPQTPPASGRQNQLLALVDPEQRLRALRMWGERQGGDVTLLPEAWREIATVRLAGEAAAAARLVLRFAGGELDVAEADADGQLLVPAVPPQVRSDLCVRAPGCFDADLHRDQDGQLFARLVAARQRRVVLRDGVGRPLVDVVVVQYGARALRQPGDRDGFGSSDRHEFRARPSPDGAVDLPAGPSLAVERIDLLFGAERQRASGVCRALAVLRCSAVEGGDPEVVDAAKLRRHQLQILEPDGVPSRRAWALLVDPGWTTALHPDDVGQVVWLEGVGGDGRSILVEAGPAVDNRPVEGLWGAAHLQLPPPRRVRVRVERGGQPVGGLELRAEVVWRPGQDLPLPSLFHSGAVRQVTTDADGRGELELPALWPIWVIQAHATGLRTQVDVRDDHGAELLLELSH